MYYEQSWRIYISDWIIKKNINDQLELYIDNFCLWDTQA